MNMERFISHWCSWCRLCAKEDPENNVSINYRGIHQTLAAGEDVKITLKEALEKYFWVQSSCEDSLPKHLCLDCYSLISSIMLFNDRVERVQQMYKFLMENPTTNPYDIRSIRLKFGVTDEKNPQTVDGTRECLPTSDEHTANERRMECLSVRIKQEDSAIENSFSECQENTAIDNENIETEEELCYEEQISNDNQGHSNDPFDVVSENETLRPESSLVATNLNLRNLARKRKSTRKKKNITERAGLRERRRKKQIDGKYKKKKILTEDFVLDAACTECSIKIHLYSMFCAHMKEAHGYDNMEKQWKCPLCDRTLQSWYNFERHMRIHIPIESRKTMKCPECDNRYVSSAQLDAHRNYKHKNDKPFICEECGICVRTNSNLRQHMLIHTDNAPFECDICKKKFKNNSRLKIHMDIHSPNKHVCAICGLQLNSRATLNRHFLVHSDEMQHKCDYCGRAFKRAKALKNHLILHTGLKPYSCDFCDRTFANGSNCRSHMKKMHPDELASLEASGNKTHTKNIPKLETLKAVTKAADNLTPVVTKFSGCFAFGKKSNETTKSPKSLKKSKKVNSQDDAKPISSLDLQNIPLDGNTNMNSNANFQATLMNSSSPGTTTIPNFDNIYQHLMKHSPNEFQIKRPLSAQSSPVNQSASLTPHHAVHNHIHQTNTSSSSNTLLLSQSNDDLLHSPDSPKNSLTPLPKIDDRTNTLSPQVSYGSIRQGTALPPGNFM